MTSVFLTRDDRVMLLYRERSAVIDDSWVGIGGHIEPEELGDPAVAALRELHEETGLRHEDVSNLSLRYVALRDTGDELRWTYYFTASLRPGVRAPTECPEGKLEWFDLSSDPPRLNMPPTAQVAFDHWLRYGRHDTQARAIVMTSDGPQTLPLAGL
jgi:8-oxo-dGTP diphosphatase